jgi:hypothetical protein
MRGLSARIVGVLAGVALAAVSAGQAQAQPNAPIVLGNPSMGSQPVTITHPSNLGWNPIAYFVDNQMQNRLPPGQSRVHTPRNGQGILVRFHNGSPALANGALPMARYRVYGGRYSFAAPQGRLILRSNTGSANTALPAARR